MRVFRLHAAMIGFLLSAFAGQSAGFTVEDFKQTRLKAERGDPEAPVALGSVFSARALLNAEVQESVVLVQAY